MHLQLLRQLKALAVRFSERTLSCVFDGAVRNAIEQSATIHSVNMYLMLVATIPCRHRKCICVNNITISI